MTLAFLQDAAMLRGNSARLMSTWQMKHKQAEPAKWRKIFPESWRERMAKKARPKVAILKVYSPTSISKMNLFF